MFETTMTGSFYRTHEIEELLKKSPTGEVGSEGKSAVEAAEKLAISDQLHPNGSKHGLTWVSNGEQRKSGYTTYVPNRFTGFSKKERVSQNFSPEFFGELLEANPILAQSLQEAKTLELPKVESPLSYIGEANAKREAEEAVKLARQLGAKRVFVPAPSPGVLTVFYQPGKAYKDHDEFLFGLAKEMAKEYRAILSVDGVDLQVDSPDLAMAKSLGVDWAKDFYSVLPSHVRAINESIAGLSPSRIRVHYCYGNYPAAHMTDPDYGKVLPEILKLKVGTIVGEMANPRHAGDPLIIAKYVRDHGWPKNMKFAAGVIDVKSPFVETPETVSIKLHNLADIDEIGPENVLGGTDCGFETFSGLGSVPKSIALKKLESLAKGASLGD